MLALACALALLLPVAASAQSGPTAPGGDPAASPAQDLPAVTSERDRVAEEVEDLRAREGDARQQLAALEEELEDAEVALRALEGELATAEEALATAATALATARSDLAAVTAELARTEAALAVSNARLEARVVAAFKYGPTSLTEVLAGVRDFGDLVSSGTLIGHVMDGDRALVAEVGELMHQVEAQRVQARDLRLDAERQVDAAEAATAAIAVATEAQAATLVTIAERRDERETLFLALREDRSAAEGHLAGLEAESARIEAQLAAIAREQAAEEARRQREAAAAAAAEAERQRAAEEAAAERADDAPHGEGSDTDAVADPDGDAGAGDGSGAGADEGTSSGGGGTVAPAPSGSWVRPTAGVVTSPFGPRWGRNHNGVDLGGSVGANIVAARAGTVVSVVASCHPTSSWGCGGGFGNYVTVAHDAGMATIYAHLSTVTVVPGESVGAGQLLGGIGNSGNSYGPHPHFEVREAGVPRNPCGYIAC